MTPEVVLEGEFLTDKAIMEYWGRNGMSNAYIGVRGSGPNFALTNLVLLF